MTQKTSTIYSDALETFDRVLSGAHCGDEQGRELEMDDGFERCMALMARARAAHHSVFVIGNGGSAAVASHIVNDLVNTGGLAAATIHDASLLTCMANDYGYDEAYARILRARASAGDLLIAISSSGNCCGCSSPW